MKLISPQQMIILTQLAEYRFRVVVSFRIAKHNLNRFIANQGEASELNEYIAKTSALLETLHEIDATFAAYFASDGSVN